MSKPVADARQTDPVNWRLEDAVVVIDALDHQRPVGPRPRLAFVEFLESLHLDDLDLRREPDIGREIDL
jgi:hypothetical protein